jgi:hypothetical protein
MRSVLHDAFNSTLAQQQQLQSQFNMQNLQQQNMMATQQPNTLFNPNYTTQPQVHVQQQQQAPWNGQATPRFGGVPQTGHTMFDPASDPTLYTQFLNNNDVNSWTANFTDPNFLVSPSEPMIPPQDMMFGFTAQGHQHRGSQSSFIQSPVELRFNGTLQSPTQPTFVNYDASSALITDNYIVPNQDQFVPPSPSTSSVLSVALPARSQSTCFGTKPGQL